MWCCPGPWVKPRLSIWGGGPADSHLLLLHIKQPHMMLRVVPDAEPFLRVLDAEDGDGAPSQVGGSLP